MLDRREKRLRGRWMGETKSERVRESERGAERREGDNRVWKKR